MKSFLNPVPPVMTAIKKDRLKDRYLSEAWLAIMLDLSFLSGDVDRSPSGREQSTSFWPCWNKEPDLHSFFMQIEKSNWTNFWICFVLFFLFFLFHCRQDLSLWRFGLNWYHFQTDETADFLLSFIFHIDQHSRPVRVTNRDSLLKINSVVVHLSSQEVQTTSPFGVTNGTAE